jgi:fluoroquinolone transport system permease protein
MKQLTAYRGLVAIDLRSVTRDSLLRWMMFVTPAIGLLLRLATPSLTATIETRFGIDLTPYYGLMMSFLPLAVAGIYGTVVGFIFLDQRDDQTLTALLVTPLSLTTHLYYRTLGLACGCVVISAITLALAGLTPMTWLQLIAVSLGAAPLAPIYSLLLGCIARNKVQGFALVKALGIIVAPCVYAYFVPEPWQSLFALIPHYWPLKAYWLFDAQRTQAALLHVLLGALSHAVVLSLLLHHFKRSLAR